MSGSLSSGNAKCLLCGIPLRATAVDHLLLHPPAAHCKVALTDLMGVSQDDIYELEAGVIYTRAPAPPPDPDVIVAFEQWVPYEKVTYAMFDHFGVPRLGGASGDRGWSSFATYQRCPYLWKRTYLDHQHMPEPVDDEDGPQGTILVEPMGLAVGSLVHTLMAIFYFKMIDKKYPLTPDLAKAYLGDNHVNPDFVAESWRLFSAYRLYYKKDYLKPIVVEHHLVDPYTKESCRYDAIVEVVKNDNGIVPGIWIMDTKTAQRFDRSTLEGWANDGTVIQQAMLWTRLGLARRFGELQGVIVNILGKQKVPGMHRSFVPLNPWQIHEQAKDLKIWQANKQLAMVTGVFPRSRASCVGRYGMCSQFEHCATGEG